ncbi:MAG: hypothetical protein GY728_15045 [Phycisphaeraceae bacterium]|nr:hypothetical protein [Phycisphaeraceae bacterium]
MNVLWPVFHDPSYRPSLAERLTFHWKANLRMLRQPRDIVLFSLISFAPLVLLVFFMRLFPDLFKAVSTPANPVPNMAPLLFTTLATFVVFLVLQHFAFVLAMNLTYVHHVRTVLLDRGVPLCPRCAQLLPPHTPAAACPECGHAASLATMRGSGSRDVDV